MSQAYPSVDAAERGGVGGMCGADLFGNNNNVLCYRITLEPEKFYN